MHQPMSFDVALAEPIDAAGPRLEAALGAEGFGILTRIDVRETFRKKLDVDFRPYSILGACNPALAHRALSARPDAGLLLPCNITIESAADGGTEIRIGNPRAMLAVGDLTSDPELASVAAEAEERLARVAHALAGQAVSPAR